MIEYNSATIYHVLGLQIELIRSETAYGWQTAAEVNGKYHYLGDMLDNVETAIEFWQQISGKTLSQVETDQVLIENGLKSLAI